MSLVSFTPVVDGATATAASVNTPFSTIYNDYNGNITDANISASAAISGTKLGDATVQSTKVVMSGCALSRSTNQVIPNSTATTVLFDVEDFDTGTYHDLVTNTSRITVPTTGKYLLTANVGFAGNPTGDRLAWFMKNGTAADRRGISSHRATGTFDDGVPVSLIISLTATDYIELVCLQNAGGNLNVNGNSTATGYTTFCCTRLGA